MEDNRNENRNFGSSNNNRSRGGRFRHGGRRDGSGHQPGRGRQQRPLLTSAINGAGLCLIALVLVNRLPSAVGPSNLQTLLASAVVVFGLSSVISYVAQRVRAVAVEKISDLLFLAGALLVIYSGLLIAGIVS